MIARLEDNAVLNLIPESERDKLRTFREADYKFRGSWDDYMEKIKVYREQRE